MKCPIRKNKCASARRSDSRAASTSCLVGETEKLRNEPGGTKKRHRQITLFRGGGMSLVLLDFDAGGGYPITQQTAS